MYVLVADNVCNYLQHLLCHSNTQYSTHVILIQDTIGVLGRWVVNLSVISAIVCSAYIDLFGLLPRQHPSVVLYEQRHYTACMKKP